MTTTRDSYAEAVMPQMGASFSLELDGIPALTVNPNVTDVSDTTALAQSIEIAGSLIVKSIRTHMGREGVHLPHVVVPHAADFPSVLAQAQREWLATKPSATERTYVRAIIHETLVALDKAESDGP